jgi:peptide/nickel transport system substrate-binding protein
MKRLQIAALLALVTAILACGPAAPPPSQQAASAGQTAQSPPRRTLVIIGRGEPPSIAAKSLLPYSGSLAAPIRLFNATLDYLDEREVPQPYLAEAIPQLNTDSWRIAADGRMETTYRLRPNLTWHDGKPLTAADFVFAWRVYATPELGAAGSLPISPMAEVAAPDPRTVLIRWHYPYADANALDLGFQPLPRHILESASGGFQDLDPQAIVNHPFWTTEYVGLGPFRIEQWQPGASIEGVAFDGHALGRPKVDRISVKFISDANAVMASMMSGEAHFVSDFILWYEEAHTLQQEWPTRGSAGTVLYAPVLLRPTGIQFRPEYVQPRSLLDVRVRRAIAHGIDGPSAVEVTTGGKGLLTYSLTSPAASYYPVVDRTLVKYPYDPRMTQRYLEEAGLVRGADGFYAHGDGEPFRLEVATDGGASNERQNTIFVDSLRRAGIDASSKVIPVAMLRDPELRTKLPALNTGGIGAKPFSGLISSAIPRPENRWSGNNRGGWSHPEVDRLWEAYLRTPSASERAQQIADMERILSEDVGMIPVMFDIVSNVHAASLKGPIQRTTPEAGSGILKVWTWEWVS